MKSQDFNFTNVARNALEGVISSISNFQYFSLVRTTESRPSTLRSKHECIWDESAI